MVDFDPAKFVTRVGRGLIREFEDAAEAGTPGLIGGAREHPARKRLSKMLPGAFSVGTGIVVDSHGGRSTQQDIVIYERDYCPVFSINDFPEATFFPVEGVAAVGEVKSTMSKAVLLDALSKAGSAKALSRYTDPEAGSAKDGYPFRMFGSSLTVATIEQDAYNQRTRASDQVFSFILCERFAQSAQTVLDNLIEYQIQNGRLLIPDLVVSLNEGFIQGMRAETMELQPSMLTADSVAFVPIGERSFAYLVNTLRHHLRDARTVPLRGFDRYMAPVASQLPECVARRFE